MHGQHVPMRKMIEDRLLGVIHVHLLLLELLSCTIRVLVVGSLALQ
jgi:hypothetical protein